MSVVPLIEGETFVTSPAEFDVQGRRLFIGNFDRRQLQGRGANVSYDLRVGPQYRDHREPHPSELGPNEKITLIPGAAVLVYTEEEVHFPHCMFGYVVPKVGLLQKGLSNTLSKVDPGYPGRLVITIFNLGKQKLHVARGDAFCALVVHRVEEGATLYEGGAKQIAGLRRRSFRFLLRQVNDKLDEYHTSVLAALVLVGLLELFSRFAPFVSHLWHWLWRFAR
jgi:dCTP deaminase